MRRRMLWAVPALALAFAAVAALLPSGGDEVGRIGPGPAAAKRVISIPFGFSTSTVFGFDTVQLRHNARQVDVSGRVECDEPLGHFRVEVAIEQDGVVAQGHRQERCTGAVQTWRVRAVVRGPDAFDPAGDVRGQGSIRLLYRGGEGEPVTWPWGPKHFDR
jgi:hypothetical protein